MATELFIKSTWTSRKKVPNTTAYGVELNLGENAFAKLAEARSYATRHGEKKPFIYHDFDNNVVLDNQALVIDNIRSQEIKATIDKNSDENNYTVRSKIAPSGTIKVTGSPVANLDIAGFKTVTIVAGASSGYSVHGGSNQIVHSRSDRQVKNTNDIKESATIAGKADGALTVSGVARIFTANGAWAEESEYAAITSTTAAFVPRDPGDPAESRWGGDLFLESPLKTGLPGFATVTLSNGASADLLVGGTLNYSYVNDASYFTQTIPSYAISITKSFVYNTAATGILRVSGAKIGSAFNYANVAIGGGDADFRRLAGGNNTQLAKTTYVANPYAFGYKQTSETASSTTAAGALNVGALGRADTYYSRNVSGYAKVTVGKDASLGTVDATNTRNSAKDTYEVSFVGTDKEKITSTHVESSSVAAGGVVTGAKGAKFASLIGFSNVSLGGATIGVINAARFARTPYTSSSTDSKTTTNGQLTQSRMVDIRTSAALGALTLTDFSTVSGGIYGFSTVKLTNTTVNGNVIAGRGRAEEVVSQTAAIYSSSFTESTGVLGTLTMTNGGINVGNIDDFATVTLNNVSGGIMFMNAGSRTYNRRDYTSGVSGGVFLDEQITNDFSIAAGVLTVNGGDKLNIGGINGYNKISVTGGTIASGIGSGETCRYNHTERTSEDAKGVHKYTFSWLDSYALAGNVLLRNTTVSSGGIVGYQTVTLDGGGVVGDIGIAVPNVFSSSYYNEYDNKNSRLLKSSSLLVISSTPTAVLTLKNGAKVSGDVSGAKILNVSGPGLPLIGGTVDMTNERIFVSSGAVLDVKKDQTKYTALSSSSRSAAGTFAASGAMILGGVSGAAKFTAALVIGPGVDVDGRTTGVSSGYGYVVTNSGGSLTILEGSSTSFSSAAGVATLSSSVLGDLYGYTNVSMKGGAIGNASGATVRNAMSGTLKAGLYQGSSGATLDAGVAFRAKDFAYVSGGIAGYKAVLLENLTSGAWIDGVQSKFSEVIKTTFVHDAGTDAAVAQTRTWESSTSPATALTLQNGALVSSGAVGIKTATLTGAAEIKGDLVMSGWSEKDTNNVNSNNKTKLFEQNRQYSCGVVGGILSLNKAYISNDDATVGTGGNVYGAARVTMTDAYVAGDMCGCGANYWSSSIVAKGKQVQSSGNIISGAVIDVDSASAVEWNDREAWGNSAAGVFTLTGGSVGGAISNYAVVKLTGVADDYATVGCVAAGAYSNITSAVYKNKVFTSSVSIKEGVLGTLTATCVTFADADFLAERFATVTLTDCRGSGGSIWGGATETSWNVEGSGDSFDAARRNAGSAAWIDKYTAAGTVTATRTSGIGSIVNCATVNLTDCSTGDIGFNIENSAKTTLTLAGSNTIGDVSGFTSVTVKSGDTAAGACTCTAGADTVTINAGAALTVNGWAFGEGSDKAVINGTVRLLGALSNSGSLALSGSGIVATTSDNLNDLYDAWKQGDLGDLSLTGSLSLVNAGKDESTVSAIRTKKEELADNKAAGARKFAGDEMIGWLSGEDNIWEFKFADTEDWIKFNNVKGASYWVELDAPNEGRSDEVTVEVYKGGKFVDTVDWNETAKRYEIDNTAFAAGAEYQLRLKTADGAAALAYAFKKL